MSTETPKKKAVSKKKASVKKAAPKKAAVASATPAAEAPAKVAVKKSVKKASRKKAGASPTTISYQERYQKIQEAAYLIAEQHGFAPGRELKNWLEAEIQIDHWIETDKLKLVS